MACVPHPGTRHRSRPLPIPGQQGHDDFAKGQQGGLRKDPHQVEPGVALQDDAELVTTLQGLQGDVTLVDLDAGHRE